MRCGLGSFSYFFFHRRSNAELMITGTEPTLCHMVVEWILSYSQLRSREYDSLLDNAGVLIVKYKQDMWKRLLFT